MGASVTTNVRRAKRLRQSILKWAFEGKLADQDPNDEPASVLLERIRAERAATQDDNKKTTRKAGRPAKRS
jgi:type I restriction enzyme, S subunit